MTLSMKARELVAEGALLLDVRSPMEFMSGHIPGATNIPAEEVPDRLAEVMMLGLAVAYCRSGNVAKVPDRTTRPSSCASDCPSPGTSAAVISPFSAPRISTRSMTFFSCRTLPGQLMV